MAADPRGGIWLGLLSGEFARYSDGAIKIIESPLPPRRIYDIALGADGAILVATTDGLIRWNNGVAQVLNSKVGLPCDAVYSVIADAEHSLWIESGCALIEISAAEMARWWKSPESNIKILRQLDALDGFTGPMISFSPTTKTPDGRLWFAHGTDLQVVDPQHLNKNAAPPPVHIESVVADHHEYRVQKPLRIPPLTRTLEIDYAALSMAVPQRVRFRYRLEGHDADWQDVGTRRQAYYNDIPPGRYRFRVIACNSSGVWNEVGDVIELDLAPAWFQTLWFRLFMVALGVAIVAVFYRIRIRQVSAIFNVRLEERARLSRDIHDSLLQTVQGSKLLADNALAQTGDGDPLRPTLARLSDWLGQAIREGRDSLNAMRASAATPENLSVRIRRLFESLQAPEAMQLTLDVRGLEPPMQAKAQEQVYVIVQEAIRNAYQHSKGARIAVDAECIADLRIQVRDDGVGFDPSAQSADRLNHFGLKSMVERATQIGGKLEIQSSVGNGTIITLTVPGGALFNKRENIFAALIRRIPEWHRSTQ